MNCKIGSDEFKPLYIVSSLKASCESDIIQCRITQLTCSALQRYGEVEES